MGLQGLLPLASEFGYPNSMLAASQDSRPVMETESDFSITDHPENYRSETFMRSLYRLCARHNSSFTSFPCFGGSSDIVYDLDSRV